MIQTILIYGLVLTALYSLTASGFSLIFGVADVINLSHGMIIIIACYVVFALVANLHLPLWIAEIVGIAASMALIWIIYMAFVRRMLTAPHTSLLLVTAGLGMVIQHVVILLVGPQTKYVPSMITGSSKILGVVLSNQQILSVTISFSLVLALGLFLQKTKLGRAIRAVSQDKEAAQLSGINSDRAFIAAMLIAGFLAGAAGILVAPIQSLIPDLGWELMITAFTVTVLAGLGGPIWGMVLAAAIVGYSEIFTAFFISPELKEAASFVIMILTLMFRPSGLFGKRGLN